MVESTRGLKKIGCLCMRRFFELLVVLVTLCVTNASMAGTLSKEELASILPAPFVAGEKEAKLPVWPIYQKQATGMALAGWVFESIDLEPVRGYSGKPINLMVFMDQKGSFLDVRLREHKEPLFLSEFGIEQLSSFAKQYKGLSLQHNITMVRPKQPTHVADGIATVNGIAAGTVTAIAMERSIMESALKVAQAGLGGAAVAGARRATKERFEEMSIQALNKAGFSQQVSITHGEVDAGFRGTLAVGLDDRPGQLASELVLDFSVVLLSLEQVGRNLLDAASWAALEASKSSGELSFLVREKGRYRLAGNEKKPAGHVVRLRITNPSLKGEWLELREVPSELVFREAQTGPAPRVFRTVGARAMDLQLPLTMAAQVTREVGFDPVRRFYSSKEFVYQPENFVHWLTAPPESRWKAVWRSRALDLGILLLGLAVLSVALWRQTWLTAVATRLRNFRFVYLVFTLGFIGWYAQGQLTIVNLTALIESLMAGEGSDFLLSDPISLVLWGFVILSLFVWGRGTFCGWLCPFGALQDLIAQVGAKLRIKRMALKIRTDERLKLIKYIVLFVLIASAVFSSPWTETAIEVEPFKTAISLYFVRDWPYVAWAVLCLALSLFVFRGYCRYVCPLGAALALFGRVRLFDWIPRKSSCGTPCQTCRHSCNYQSIAPVGKVNYTECFQCLDCVSIEQDVKRCLPLIREAKVSRVIPLHAVTVSRSA
jgi:NosR/NirI family transcriptional regulator, nitrous oxide reductase regulator